MKVDCGKFLLLSCLTSCSSNMDDIMFLDYAASAAINEEALEEFNTVSKINGNSSGINNHANLLKNIEYKSSQIIAQKINADPGQILFTNSATLSNNIAILGVAYNNPGCHLITSKIEHKSVLEVFKHLEDVGFSVTYLDVDRYGNIALEQLSKSITPRTKLISIQAFNSEIGTTQNLKAIGEIAEKNNVLFHSDAAQSFCKYTIDVKDINVDLLTISGYKIGAPKGIAALYVKDKSKLRPILFGSGDNIFPGTKPTALIASFAAAVKNYSFNLDRINSNFHALISELSKIDRIHINSISPSHVVSISIDGVLLKDIMKNMKYSFSSGCSCSGQEQSNVIKAIDPEDKLPSCTIRISFADNIDRNDLISFAQNLKKTVDQLRSEKSVGKGCPHNSDNSH